MNEQIKTTTVDQLPEATDTKNFWIFGYKSDNPAGKRSVRFAFDKIAALFGLSQTTGTSTTLAMSQKATTDELNKRALATKTDGSKVLYTDKDGKIPASVLSVASDKTDGLMSIEHFKFIENMATNMDELIEAVYAASGKDEDSFNTQVIAGCTNETPMILNKAISTAAYLIGYMRLIGKGYRSKKSSFSIKSYTDLTLTEPSDTINILCLDLTQFNFNPDAKNINSVTLISEDEKMLQFSAGISSLEYLNVSQAPFITSLYATTTSKLSAVNLEKNTLLNMVHFRGSGIKALELNTAAIKNIYVDGCANLTTLTNKKNMPALVRLEANNNKLSKNTIVNFCKLWDSRVGLETGILIISQAVYDAMTEDEKLEIINKNITIQFK